MSYGWGYPPYVSVAAKKAKAEKKLKQLMKKNPDIRPIIIEGRTIAKTWWGKSWNINLESYADYSNRIGRGRSYVRHGAVLDLEIKAGKITSLVQGTSSKPYSITVSIKEINKSIWNKIRTACEGKLESLHELIEGKFPKSLSDIFATRGSGLFPSPDEIDFTCSCPDWAGMCKHVAATLYGAGARLDDDPALFFKLRKVEVGELISEAVKGKTKKLLKKAENKSSRVISDTDISGLFGIEMGEEGGSKQNKKKGKHAVKKEKSKSIKKQKEKNIPVKPIKSKAKKTAVKKAVNKTQSKKVQTAKKSVRKSTKKSVKKGVKSKKI